MVGRRCCAAGVWQRRTVRRLWISVACSCAGLHAAGSGGHACRAEALRRQAQLARQQLGLQPVEKKNLLVTRRAVTVGRF